MLFQESYEVYVLGITMEIIKRVLHKTRNKIKDCKHICLFCNYYKQCEEELQDERKIDKTTTKEN